MKRFAFAFPLALIFSTQALAAPAPKATPKPPHAAHAAKVKNTKRPPTAPADVYFGRQKLSILGVRNSLHDLDIRFANRPDREQFLYDSARPVEEAMHDWDKRYHGDLWLAHYLFQLDQIYMRVPSAEGKSRVRSMSAWIIADYPNTYYGRYLKKIAKISEEKKKAANASPSPSSTAAESSAAPKFSPSSKPQIETPSPFLPTPSATHAASPSPSETHTPSPKPTSTPAPKKRARDDSDL